jgi:hypothetical protein
MMMILNDACINWTTMQRLHTLDARKFVVANVGPLGCIPYQKTINRVGEDECVKLPNQLAAQYNARLRELIVELNGNLPGARFCLANVYDLVMELITNYPNYGMYCRRGGAYAFQRVISRQSTGE